MIVTTYNVTDLERFIMLFDMIGIKHKYCTNNSGTQFLLLDTTMEKIFGDNKLIGIAFVEGKFLHIEIFDDIEDPV